MKYCDWCKKACDETVEAESAGNIYNICKACDSKLKQGVCRICGKPIGFNSIEGKCIVCTQVDYTEARRKQEEMTLGIDAEMQRILSSPLEFTDEDYERWMTYGKGDIDPEIRRGFRKKWVIDTFDGKFGWTAATLNARYPVIEKLLDRNFSKMLGKQLAMVDLSITKVKVVTCVDSEDSIILIHSDPSTFGI